MNFRKPILLSVVASTVLFSGCASITSGKQQNISVKAICDGKPVTGAQCELTNDKGSWFTNTPGSVGIHKSYGDMTVTCTKGDAKGVATFTSANEGSVWGNVIAGGIIGYAWMQTQVLDSHINLFFKSRWKEVALKSNAIKVKRNY